MYKAHHWALYHMWFQNKSDLYDLIYIYIANDENINYKLSKIKISQIFILMVEPTTRRQHITCVCLFMSDAWVSMSACSLTKASGN